MPTLDALAREDAVLALVCQELSRADRGVTIDSRPDRQPPGQHPFDVDALLRVRGSDGDRVWAADVCLLPLPQEMTSAVASFEERVVPELAKLAEQAGRALTVSCHPRLFSPDSTRNDRKRQVAADTVAITQAAAQALASGQDHLPAFDDELRLQIFVHDYPKHADGSAVAFMPFVGGTDPDIANQVRRDLAPHVREKLDKQLRAPRQAGHPTVLILDQKGHGGMAVPTNFLASPATIRGVVEECLADFPGVLDACVLVTPEDQVIELIGAVGVPRHDPVPGSGRSRQVP
ncbi:hypothetical protein [Streptomyces sp. CA-106131]|uniref:hypothetical protein n=1 Tax=Streptomyces sp. CA-106131 TaxID=3240045 RepID=UPI003D8CFB4E